MALSALLWRGMPHRLRALIRQRSNLQLCNSPALLEELAGVLGRPSASKRLALIGKTARDVLADYVEAIELVEPTAVPRVVAEDAADDHVLACALAAQAA